MNKSDLMLLLKTDERVNLDEKAGIIASSI
jgi:hypothetical protein